MSIVHKKGGGQHSNLPPNTIYYEIDFNYLWIASNEPEKGSYSMIVTLWNQTKFSRSTSSIVDSASVIDNVDKLA